MYVNIMLTMLLGGLWHGASWNFVFWGGLHGISLAIHKAWISLEPVFPLKKLPAFQMLWSLFSRLLTLGVVLLGWIFFRAESWGAATQYVTRLATWTRDGTHLISPYILPAAAAVFLVHLLVNKDRNWAHEIAFRPLPSRILAYSSLALLLVCLAATDSAPFIYFQF
jgi:D-alanyl-lipoteichoic acid acyltransferase DltB (MBOAT superfamily)